MFTTDVAYAGAVLAGGGAGVVIDWERRGKRRRQAAADTQINTDTPRDLAAVRAGVGPPGRVICRVNGWGAWSEAEIEQAVGLGADEILLPMVRRPEEVDAALGVVGGRCGLGLLVETTEAVRRVDELLVRPVARAYLGLNDLMIERGGRFLFTPLVDGTVDHVGAVAAAAGVPFGVAGLTRPEAGRPVPCRLLLGALARIDASFTFLRRSFAADVAGRDPAVEVGRILAALDAARRRPPEVVTAEHAELETLVGLLTADEAV